ncbi:MAG: aliphatic sulfonate ABC transporter substrate-binding protein [Gracilibacteraceae bacterium]|jgi:sulfonate transport system substrate-binding protein|nr:aliphatic sulfonate ABC transporter substrate-binding protein [Gracilibacteraceae bacterium]
MNTGKILFFAAALALSAILTGCAGGGAGSGAAAGTGSARSAADAGDQGYSAAVLRVAIQPSAAFVPIYLLRDNGWLEEEAEKLGVTVEWTEFVSGPPMNESFAAGQQDIGFIGDVPTVPTVSAIFAGQQNTVVGVAAWGEGGYAILVAQDSPIAGAEDLRGGKVGLTVGSTAQNLVEKYFKANGLDINNDVEVVNLTVGDLATALANDQIDAAAVWEPSITRLTDDGIARVLADGTGILRGTNNIFSTTAFAEENPKLVQLLLEQYARAAKALKDDPLGESAKVAAAYSLSPEQLAKVTDKYDYSVVVADEDIECLRGTTDFLRNIGVVTDPGFDIADHIDPSYANNADLAQYK